MSVCDHYIELIERGRTILEETFKDTESNAAFTRAHNFIPEYELLCNVIVARPEAKVLALSIREYQFALYALAAGNYRHAYISLRLFLELALSTIHFSASELKLRKWLANQDDIIWSALVHRESGIYSASFISAFEPELASLGKQYGALAEKVYRECSEHVHGNIHTHAETDAPITYNKDACKSWNSLADSAHLCIVFAFAARFLKFLGADERNQLEAVLLDALGTHPAIQAYYQKTAK